MTFSKKNGRKVPVDSELKEALPRLPEAVRRRILGYIEDYFKSKNEKIH